MTYFLMPGKRAGRTSSLPSSFVNRVVNAARELVSELRAPVPASTPVAVEPDDTEFYAEADMPAAEDIAEAARLYFRAADEARTADRAKRKAKKILDRLRAGTYSGWEITREPSGRQTVDLEAVRATYKRMGLGPVPMRSSADSLKVRRVELDLNPEVVEAELSTLAGAR